ncbi:unnamed protein product [Blepharisma stoltei]|uniref:Uncharacterized protein n=1 Tax=Blepharisma stoltei TaxID=1481888 RepID=A0AAU9J916_9CILI|nr:unnamed protein product [Blepharisma stoltei]
MNNERHIRAISWQSSENEFTMSLIKKIFPAPKWGQVLIKVEIAPIHHMDFEVLKYCSTKSVIPGCEGAGRVISTGSGINWTSMQNKRVSFIQFDSTLPGSWSEYVLCSSKSCAILNEDIDYIKGSVLMRNPLTVLMINEHINNQKLKAIIHIVDSSNLGKMIVKWCNFSSIDCINIVKKKNDENLLVDIGQTNILCFEDLDFNIKFQEMVEKIHPAWIIDRFGENDALKVLENIEHKCELVVYEGNTSSYHCTAVPNSHSQITYLNLKQWFQKLSSYKRRKYFQQIQKLSFVFSNDISGIFPAHLYKDAISVAKEPENDGRVLLHIGEDIKEDIIEIFEAPEENSSFISEEDFAYTESDEVERIIEQFEKSKGYLIEKSLPKFEWGEWTTTESDTTEVNLKFMPDNSVYSGEWARNHCHGKGERFYHDGSYYQGYWNNGNTHGMGRLIRPDGEYYEGQWKDSMRYGEGKLCTVDNIIFQGEFYENNIVRGKEIRSDGKCYEGDFDDWKWHGHGKLVMPNGETFEGIFEKGVYMDFKTA